MLGFKKMFLIALFLIASSISFLYALTYDQCFEIERIKAQREGAGFQESVDYAKDICGSKKENTVKKEKSSTQPDFYIGTALKITGDGTLKNSNAEITIRGRTTKLLTDRDKKEKLKRKASFKLGARLPNWRASLQWYTLQFEGYRGYESSLRLVIFDYLHPSGFFVGGGLGTGSLDSGWSKEGRGTARAYNIGYELSVAPQLLIGFGYLSTSSDFTTTVPWGGTSTIKDDYTLTTWSTYADISYIF